MKKNRICCGILAALLFMNLWLVPVRAEPETETTVPAESSFVPTIPWETQPVISGLEGDASVSGGSHSINAQVPMASVMDYAADCKAALLYEIDTETLVYAYNADDKLYPASLTKVMTCLVALDLCQDLYEEITVPEEIIAAVDPSGSTMDLVAGEEIYMIDLLYGLMVESANDAASVIANHLCGSEEAFVRKMNQKAQELGCWQSHFVNVHGLHDEDHYTTARDMAKILLAALEHETFQDLYSTSYYEIEATNKSEMRKMSTTNYLISRSVYETYYDSRVIGGKTGTTTPAGRCLVTVSESNGMRLLCVIMGAEMKVAEDGWTVLSYGTFEETKGLIDYGFDHFMPTQVMSPNQILGQFPVEYGSAAVQGMVSENSDTLVPVNSDMSSVRYEYILDEPTLQAPIRQGDALGVVRVWYMTRCLAQQELYAAVSVEKDIPTTVSGGNVDPAAPVGPGSVFWHIVLIAIVAVLGLIVLMLAVGYIRGAILRAKRARRRKNRRRSR